MCHRLLSKINPALLPFYLANIYGRLEWVFETYGELLNLWCHPQDLDEFDHALLELTNYFLGNVS